MAGQISVPRVKFCGITSVADAELACKLGADALGLVFYAPSPRAVNLEQAAAIVAATQPLVSIVALFVDPQTPEVEQVLATIAVDVLQFHGNESQAFCEQFARPYIKACRIREPETLAHLRRQHPRARAYLCDSYRQEAIGGTGHSFNWDWLQGQVNTDVVLAGGLHAGNVAAAIDRVRPGAVDVSSGIEVSPGRKDEGAMRDFISAVRNTSTRAV